MIRRIAGGPKRIDGGMGRGASSAGYPRVRGAAIVVAMLLAAFAATIATTLLWQQQRWAGEYEHRRDQVQAQALAMAGIHWARQILYDDARSSAIDHLGETWALRLPPTPIENGSITGFIVDAQGRLNIDNLAAATALTEPTRGALTRLFGQLGLPPTLLNAVTDWVDSDAAVREPGGAEDAFYLAQGVPGLAANAPIERVAELLAVRGGGPAQVGRLLPFVEAIAAPTTVNVNTAPPEVLAATIVGLDADGVALLVAARDKAAFTSVADFKARLPKPDLIVDEAMLSVRSDYFVVSVEARQGETIARARALLKRVSGEWPAVLWQTVE